MALYKFRRKPFCCPVILFNTSMTVVVIIGYKISNKYPICNKNLYKLLTIFIRGLTRIQTLTEKSVVSHTIQLYYKPLFY